MRKVKRWVSLLLVLVMSLGMIQTSAFALGGEPGYDAPKNNWITAHAQDADTLNPLPGVQLQLEDITAGRYTNLGTQVVQGADGVTWKNLAAGTYRLTQVGTPDTHVENTQSQIIVLKESAGGEHVTAPVFKSQVRGSILIMRISSKDGSPVPGGTYQVTNSRTGEASVYTGKTGPDGSVLVPSLPEGEYIVRELTPPAGFSNLTQAMHVIVRGDRNPTPCIFTDAPWATASCLLLDKVTGAPLQGARFVVTRADGTTVPGSEAVTNANGVYVCPVTLEAGEYILKQVGPAVSGYQDDFVIQTFSLRTDGEGFSMTGYNTPLGSWTVTVYDSITGKPLPGATVTLRDDKNQIVTGTTNPLTTDQTGTAKFTGLKDGHYTASIVGPDGHVMDTSSVSINIKGGSNEALNLTGTEKGSLLIRCLDEDGKPLPGASFRISRMNGDYIGDVTTGPDGTVTTGNLESGQYLVEQTKVPNGYVADSATKTVTLRAAS